MSKAKINWRVCEWVGLDEEGDLRLSIQSYEDGLEGYAYDCKGNEHPFPIPPNALLEDVKALGEKFLETLS